MKIVSVIIVNWNGEKFLKECLDSLFRQSYKQFEVIVVDNGSTDNSLELLKKYKVKVISLKENKGFAKANNIGIKNSKGDYVATLNNDTKVDKNWLKELVKVIEKTDAGFLASKMLFYDNPKKVNSKGLKLYFDAKAVDLDFNTDDKKEDIKEVFGICGGAAFFKRELIRDISFDKEFFDEDFFLYSEDLDVSFRARLRGWKCLYVPTAIVYHKVGATAKRINDVALYHSLKNKVFVIIKNYPLIYLIKYSPIIILRQIISFFYYLVRLNPSSLKARLMIFVKLPKMLRKRWKIQRTRKVKNEEIKKWFNDRSVLDSLFSN